MLLRRVKDVLFVLAILGAVAAVIRLGRGLGATTNLSDGIPWGFWKVLNMVAGVALATCGFVLAFGVHVLHIKSLKPVLRPAILIAFLGYGASCMALLFDIGLPHRFWKPLLHWNPNSFLFEVFWCVMLYFTVTVLEVSPIALEKSRFGGLLRFTKKILPVVIILGITLSCLHHTSLGFLFTVSGSRIYGLWSGSGIGWLFFLSAVGAGLMSVVLVTLIVARLYGREAPTPVVGKLAGASAVILSLYLAAKAVDLLARGKLGLLISGDWESVVYIVEVLIAAVLPIALVAVPKVRRSTRGLAWASGLAVLGVMMNRVDVGIVSYFRSAGTVYVPSLAELALTLGIPATAGLFFFWFIEHFRVFTFNGHAAEAKPLPAPSPTSFQPQTKVWNGVFLNNLEQWTLMAVFVVPVAIALFGSKAGAEVPKPAPVQGPLGQDDARDVLRLDGDRNGTYVLFRHEDHKKWVAESCDLAEGEEACARCHHLDRPGDRFSSCYHCHSDMNSPREIFDHELHVAKVAAREGHSGPLAGNHSCAECHAEGEVRSAASAKACSSCHAEDMRMSAAGRPGPAIGYRLALHRLCVGCHEMVGPEVRSDPEEATAFSECANCHGGGPGR